LVSNDLSAARDRHRRVDDIEVSRAFDLGMVALVFGFALRMALVERGARYG
jgi:hypothetical protein